MKIIGMAIAAAIALIFFTRSGQRVNPAKTASDKTRAVKTAAFPETPISIDYLRKQRIAGSPITIEQDLGEMGDYHEYIASYKSEGNTIYGLLTVPDGEMPAGGWPAIVFNHGYIPPTQYVSTERYVAYVDALARNGFVVFKIDFRGNGQSQGQATGSYFSPGYTIDAVAAVKSLQQYKKVNPNRIGMWGHSMSGNVTLRAMEVSPDIKAGVIWAGAVYSYADMVKYGIHDSSFVRRTFEQNAPTRTPDKNGFSAQLQEIRTNPGAINFSSPLWRSVSLTSNLNYLRAPLQLDHAIDDPVVNIGYSRDLAAALRAAGKKYELNEFDGGGHNIESPYFDQAMEKTIAFFRQNL